MPRDPAATPARTAPPRRGTAVRPRRGQPDETRARLVAAAAAEFNRVGFHGTDSNRLARAAGYAPGTFYKHFPDKRAIFLAAYEAWVDAEWAGIRARLSAGGPAADLATSIVDATLALHRRWRGLRASLRLLVAQDPEARAFYRAQRRRQIALLAELGRRGPAAKEDTAVASTDRDALLLYTLERVSDAIADGELRDLGASTEGVRELLIALVRDRIEPTGGSSPRPVSVGRRPAP